MRKRELESLLNALLPHAEQMLSRYGDFYPYAGVIRRDGSLEGLSPPVELPETLEGWRAGLLAVLRGGAREERYRATGLVINVEVDVPGGQEGARAIRITLEHESGVGYDVYIPYWMEGTQVALGEPMAAAAGQCEVFSVCYEVPVEVPGASDGVAALG